MADLSRKGARKELPIRREPYWHKLDTSAYLGFRRGPDTWIARFRERAGNQNYKALKLPAECRDEFIEAKRLAQDWFGQMRGVGSGATKRGTVQDGVQAYLTNLERQGRTEAAAVARARFRVILPESDPLSGQKLESAKREDFEAWRERLSVAGRRGRKKKNEGFFPTLAPGVDAKPISRPPDPRGPSLAGPGRKPQSINRYTDSMAAALNAALKLGHVGDARAWTLDALTNDASHDEDTAVFLSPIQRKALLANAAAAAAEFFHGLELTGARPGELARARVSDFDGEQIRFTHRKGRPPKLRVRHTVLSAEGVDFFKRMAKDKAADAPLIGNPEGNHWPRTSWAEAMRNAIAAHHEKCGSQDRLPAGVSAYAFRHSRISELLQIHGIDPLTVAMQTGTSLQQIEKTYYKFIPSAMKAKLAAVRESV